MSAPVAVIDTTSDVVLSNHAWSTHFGPAVVPQLVAGLPDGDGEVTYALPGAPEVVWTVRAVSLPGGRRVVSCRDVTESRSLHEAIEQQRAALNALGEEATRVQRDLADVVSVSSHDLRTALRGIALLTQWVGEDVGPNAGPETRQHLDLLAGRVSRMEAMIEALLRYLRLGEVPEEPSEVDTGVLVDAITRKLTKPPGISVVVGTPMPRLLTLRTQLRLVLAELIENAVAHHDREEGTVMVAARDHGAHIEFCVHDDGPGLQERTQERIFRLFQTAGDRDPVRHVGVGLAVVKRLVEGRGGSVAVRSQEPRGSAFCFTWPKLQLQSA